MKKLPYVLHLILLNLLVFFIIAESKINNLFIIPVVLLFMNLVFYQYCIELPKVDLSKKHLKYAYLLERFTSMNALVACIALILVTFSSYTANKDFALVISAFSIIHLVIYSSYFHFSEFIYNHIDDLQIEEIDDKALRGANNFHTLPYYLLIVLFLAWGYFKEFVNDVDLILLFALSVGTIPFFVRGPSKAKKLVRMEKKYIYNEMKLPIQLTDESKYNFIVFLMLALLYSILYFIPNIEYLANIIIIAVISLHSLSFSEYDTVISYYLKEMEKSNK